MNNSIVIIKLYSGEMIVGRKETPTVNAVINMATVLLEPRMLMVVPSGDGTVRVGIYSVAEPFNVPRLKQKIEIQNSQILYKLEGDEVDESLANAYMSEIAGIKMASAEEKASLGRIL